MVGGMGSVPGWVVPSDCVLGGCATFWDFAFNSCVVHLRRKETASGDTEQTQKLLEAREMEWEARLKKKKGTPLVTSFGGAKMFLSMSCRDTTFLVSLVSRVASG